MMTHFHFFYYYNNYVKFLFSYQLLIKKKYDVCEKSLDKVFFFGRNHI